jgi:hypothetical protein
MFYGESKKSKLKIQNMSAGLLDINNLVTLLFRAG